MNQTCEDRIISIKSKLMSGVADYKSKNNLTQREVGLRCGIDQARVSRLLNGEFDKFTIDQLIKITYRLGIELKLLSLAEK